MTDRNDGPIPTLILARHAARLLSALLLCAPPLRAQQASTAHVSRFTVEEGLAQNYISALAQDSAGFIWIGTPRGLQRFDGYSFVSHRSIEPGGPPALNGWINDLLLDGHGRLWIVTTDGVFWGRPGDADFRRLPSAEAVAPDSAARLWLVDEMGRVGWIDWQNAAPRVTLVRSDTIADCCATLATTRTGSHVWLVPHNDNHGGMIRLDVATGATLVYPVEELTSVLAAAEDAAGRIWIAGYGGVEVLEPSATRFRALEAFRGRDAGDLKADGRGGFYVPTERWLARVSADGEIVERWSPPELYTSAPLLTRGMMVDREGGFWLATLAAGVARLDPTPALFEHVSSAKTISARPVSDFVVALHERGDSSLWVGTIGGGAYRLAQRWVVSERVGEAYERAGRLPLTVWAFEEDAAGQLWLGTSVGLCDADATRQRCYSPHAASDVTDVARAPDGWLWGALGPRGFASFDPRARRFETRFAGPRTDFVYVDSASSTLWLGGSQLHRARIAAGRLVGSPVRVGTGTERDAAIYDMRRDRAGALWVATYRGLQRWDSIADRIVPIELPALHGATVFSITGDATNRLWLGTSHGIVEYSPASGVARRYGRQDGVLSGEFNRRAALHRRNGELVFGGLQGLTVFRPERVHGRRADAPLVFTRWQKVTANGPVEGYFRDVAALELRPGDRAVTLEFAALTFAPGPARRYRYQIEGLNPVWIETTDHTVTYPTPRPGRYTFRVQLASGSDGNWLEPGAGLALHVLPPVWATAWFRTMVVTMILTGLWLLHRLRLRQALATERLRVRISRDLHDEIGAGLSSIALISDEVGGNGGVSADGRKQLARIAQSARRMVTDLRDIVWAIDPDEDRLQDVVARMQDVADDLLSGMRVRFHAPAATELNTRIGMAARRDLLLLYKEIVHNIARHANAGTVDITLTAAGDIVELVILDDGKGFDPATVRSGTGLKSVRERAAQLGGEFELASRPSAGTTVRVTVRMT